MHLRLLALSLVVSASLALLFVRAALWLGLHDQLAYIVPLLPVFYAVIYPALEKRHLLDGLYSPSTRSHVVLGRPGASSERRMPAILAGAAASLLAHFVLQAAAWLASGQGGFDSARPFSSGAALAFHLLIGDAVRFSGRRLAAFVGLDAAVMSLAGGLCVGALAPASALLNGLLAGVVVSMFLGASQFAAIYEALLAWSSRLNAAFKLAWPWYYGLSTVLLVQSFAFSVCAHFGSRLRAPAR